MKPWEWPQIGIYCIKKRGSLGWLSELKKNVCFSFFWLCRLYPWRAFKVPIAIPLLFSSTRCELYHVTPSWLWVSHSHCGGEGSSQRPLSSNHSWPTTVCFWCPQVTGGWFSHVALAALGGVSSHALDLKHTFRGSGDNCRPGRIG